MSYHHKPYESDRIHTQVLIKCTSGRRCSYCNRRIDFIPSDVDPRYARFCMAYRYYRIPNDVDNPLTRGL